MKTQECPVCGWEIKDEGREVKVNDRVIVIVCCEDCEAKVKAEPARYLRKP
jgi:ribosome-binding protein aMBF1 (putative translation factor)